MIDIDKKIEKIEKNCIDTAKKELNALKLENDDISEQKILEKVNSYKEELAQKYETEVNKIQREFNKNTFEYEMNEKKKISDYRQSLINEIQNKIVAEFQNFVRTPEYAQYLRHEIAFMQMMIGYNKCTIFITENDYDRFYDEYVRTKESLNRNDPEFINVTLDKISNEYIGGCIILDEINKVSIDNTLKNNIAEEIKKINI